MPRRFFDGGRIGQWGTAIPVVVAGHICPRLEVKEQRIDDACAHWLLRQQKDDLALKVALVVSGANAVRAQDDD